MSKFSGQTVQFWRSKCSVKNGQGVQIERYMQVDYSKMDNDMASMIMQTINNMLIEMYATFAYAEMQKREKRQREGIQSKKDRGDWDNYGRPMAIDYKVFKTLYSKVISKELKPFECMRQLGMTKPTFYRYKHRYEKEVCGY